MRVCRRGADSIGQVPEAKLGPRFDDLFAYILRQTVECAFEAAQRETERELRSVHERCGRRDGAEGPTGSVVAATLRKHMDTAVQSLAPVLRVK